MVGEKISRLATRNRTINTSNDCETPARVGPLSRHKPVVSQGVRQAAPAGVRTTERGGEAQRYT
eukprot:734677-Rhodomonas_salina.2